jgi:hypothetical protein
MNLITGKIQTLDSGKFGIENLKKIVLACEHIKALFQKLQAEKTESKGFWKRVGAFFKRLFGTYSDVEALMSDITQIIANKDQILQEIQDLSYLELVSLATELSSVFGYDLAFSKDRIEKALPQWLNGWILFLD